MQNNLPLISRIFVIFCLFTILTACGKEESNDDELEAIKEELTQLKKDKEKAEEETAKEKERSEKEKEELEQSNKEEIEESEKEETESTSNKDVSENNSKSSYESNPIIDFVEEGGKKYIVEKGGTGLNDPDTYYDDIAWCEVTIKMYDTELQNFYNNQPNNLQSLVSSSLYEQFSANKNSGNFSNHKSSIDCISATKYDDWTVLVTAVRNYSHASGSGSIKNQYYIDLMNGGRVAYFKAVD